MKTTFSATVQTVYVVLHNVSLVSCDIWYESYTLMKVLTNRLETFEMYPATDGCVVTSRS